MSFEHCRTMFLWMCYFTPVVSQRYLNFLSFIYIYIYIYIIKLFPSLIRCLISCTIESFNWIMVKIQLSFKYSQFHVNYFTIFSLITTLSTHVTKSLLCKGIFLSDVTWRHAWSCFKSILILVATLGGDFWSFIQQVFVWVV